MSFLLHYRGENQDSLESRAEWPQEVFSFPDLPVCNSLRGTVASLPMKEAAARIKINKLLEAAGWRFFSDANGPVNIQLEATRTTSGIWSVAIPA